MAQKKVVSVGGLSHYFRHILFMTLLTNQYKKKGQKKGSKRVSQLGLGGGMGQKKVVSVGGLSHYFRHILFMPLLTNQYEKFH